jgi:branched-chain amino acid transport system ATP-binding protein
MSAELELTGLRSGYGGVEVLHGVDLTIPARGITALLGRNGGGKSTLLSTISGLVPARAGQVRWDALDITSWSAQQRAAAGLVLVPERRGVFPPLTVREHLQVFARDADEQARLPEVLDMLPALADRLSQLAGSLSGGEQQMLALSRALLQRPRLLLLDELSFGLAPRVAGQLFDLVQQLAETATVLLVEQYVHDALRLADVVYVLERGEIVFAGEPGELQPDAPHYGLTTS